MTEIQESVGDFEFRRPGKDARRNPNMSLLTTIHCGRKSSTALDLENFVKSQVVPRLYEVHRKDLRGKRSDASYPLVSALENEVTALGDRLLASDHTGACEGIDALRTGGLSLERIYLDLLTPTASHLRRLWIDDVCGMAEATLGLLNLQTILRHFACAFRAERSVRQTGLHALLVSPRRVGLDVFVTIFDLVMASEFFRRGGWNAWIEPDLSNAACRDIIRDQWFDIVEICVSDDKQLDGIASEIHNIRRTSANRSVGIMVRGQIFVERPELADLVGADLTSFDPGTSLTQANQFASLSFSQASHR